MDFVLFMLFIYSLFYLYFYFVYLLYTVFGCRWLDMTQWRNFFFFWFNMMNFLFLQWIVVLFIYCFIHCFIFFFFIICSLCLFLFYFLLSFIIFIFVPGMGIFFFIYINMRRYLCLQCVYGCFTLEFVRIPTLARLRSPTSVRSFV